MGTREKSETVTSNGLPCEELDTAEGNDHNSIQ